MSRTLWSRYVMTADQCFPEITPTTTKRGSSSVRAGISTNIPAVHHRQPHLLPPVLLHLVYRWSRRMVPRERAAVEGNTLNVVDLLFGKAITNPHGEWEEVISLKISLRRSSSVLLWAVRFSALVRTYCDPVISGN